jgi:hypothetical protein
VSVNVMKKDLEIWGGALLARIDERIDQRFAEQDKRIDQRFDELAKRFDEMLAVVRKTLSDELRRHANANAEDLATRFTVLDDKYRDLPARVTRLETKAFKPRAAKRPATARRRSR